MKVLVIGAGMYVTGRSGGANATILSSLAEASKSLPIQRVVVAARNPENARTVREVAQQINRQLGSALEVAYAGVGGEIDATVGNLVAQHGIDTAIVAVPDDLHCAYTRALLTRRIPSLVVKPLAPTLAEARELVRLQEETQVWGAVEFHKRFDEANQYAKKIYREGQLGQLLYATVDYSQRIVIPTQIFRSWCETTNPFQYLGVHYVDLLYYITGWVPVAVSAVGISGRLRQEGLDVFDSIHASVLWQEPGESDRRFYSGFNINWVDPGTTSAMSDQRYKLIGTKGRIELDQKYRGITMVTEDAGIREPNPYFSEYLEGPASQGRFSGYGHQSIQRFLQDVLDVRAGTATISDLAAHRPGFRQALVSVAVAEAAAHSMKNGFVWTPVETSGLT